jgi:hypothetical protein
LQPNQTSFPHGVEAQAEIAVNSRTSFASCAGAAHRNPFARIILAFRVLNLRLWFFRQAIAPILSSASPTALRAALARHLDACADQLHALTEGVLTIRPVPPLEPEPTAAESPPVAGGAGVALAFEVAPSIIHRLTQDLQTVTTTHNALLASLRRGRARALAALSPITTGVPLIDGYSVRAAAKLVLLILLLLAEEGLLRFPGGTQVAFFAVFFASTGNLGRQNKTDLTGLLGIFLGIIYGIVAALLTTHVGGFPLILVLVFLGEFLALMAYQRLPLYGNAGLHGAPPVVTPSGRCRCRTMPQNFVADVSTRLGMVAHLKAQLDEAQHNTRDPRQQFTPLEIAAP